VRRVPARPVLLVVESMADYSDGLCDTDLQDLVRLAAAHGHCLLAESEASRAMSCSSSSFGGALRAARTGLFLHPDSHEGDSVFKTDVPGAPWEGDLNAAQSLASPHPAGTGPQPAGTGPQPAGTGPQPAGTGPHVGDGRRTAGAARGGGAAGGRPPRLDSVGDFQGGG